jgi:hypothetical protein
VVPRLQPPVAIPDSNAVADPDVVLAGSHASHRDLVAFLTEFTPSIQIERRWIEPEDPEIDMWGTTDRIVKTFSDLTVGTLIVLVHAALADRQAKQAAYPFTSAARDRVARPQSER